MPTERIQIKGLSELSRSLRKIDKDAPKGLRLVQNEAANLLIAKTRPKIPAISGRARASLKARSTRTLTRIVVGGNKARYYPWLDFGGKTPGHHATRPFYKEGRYLYPTLAQIKPDIESLLAQGIVAVAKDAGLVVD